MTLEEQLQDAYERAAERAPVAPGAYDRFLRRRARRGRVVATAAGLALVAVLGAAVLVARPQPQDQEPVAPADGVVRVPQQGFELPVPAGWKLQRQLTGPGSQVVGVVLVPRSGEPAGAAITVAVEDDQPVPKYAGYLLDLQVDASRRADGRLYKLRAGRAGRLALREGPGRPLPHRLACLAPLLPAAARPAGQPPACRQAALRVLLVTGAAAPGDAAGVQQVLGVMGRVVATVRPIGDALRPPHWLTTKVLLGKGGSGAAAWEAWIERTWLGTADSDGFMVRFPRATPKPTWHWEQLGPSLVSIQHRGVYIQRDCLSWLPGSGLLLSGLAPRTRPSSGSSWPAEPGRGGDLRPRPTRPLGGLRVPTPARRRQAGAGGSPGRRRQDDRHPAPLPGQHALLASRWVKAAWVRLDGATGPGW